MNSASNVDESQRHAATVAGLTFLFAIVVVVLANFGVSFRFIVPDDAVETARNIKAHEMLFRINIVCNLIYATAILVLAAALYVILRPVNRGLALVAVLFRLMLAMMWGITAINTVGALRLLSNAAYLPVFEPGQLQTLARLHLTASYDAYYIGLPFWGLASAVCSYLWLKARYVPMALAAFGLLASCWCAFCALAFLIFPHFAAIVNASWFDMPILVFEIALGLWLLFKGLRPRELSGIGLSGEPTHANAAGPLT
jgi:hypothetical protein